MTIAPSAQAQQRGRPEPVPIDAVQLEAFLGRVVGDFGAIVGAAAAAIGDELGLYKAMADGEPLTPAGLAERTATGNQPTERQLRELLATAGFTRLRRAAETPFNRVFEARR